jgi:hypothetical protein
MPTDAVFFPDDMQQVLLLLFLLYMIVFSHQTSKRRRQQMQCNYNASYTSRVSKVIKASIYLKIRFHLNEPTHDRHAGGERWKERFLFIDKLSARFLYREIQERNVRRGRWPHCLMKWSKICAEWSKKRFVGLNYLLHSRHFAEKMLRDKRTNKQTLQISHSFSFIPSSG